MAIVSADVIVNDTVYIVTVAAVPPPSSSLPYDITSTPPVSPASSPVNDWCLFDTGPATVTGRDVDAYVSVTRDGSVWLRLGTGAGSASFDWAIVDRRRPRVQTPVIDDESLAVIQAIPFTDYCVLTDVQLKLTVQAGWNPSYLTFYDPLRSETRIVSLKA